MNCFSSKSRWSVGSLPWFPRSQKCRAKLQAGHNPRMGPPPHLPCVGIYLSCERDPSSWAVSHCLKICLFHCSISGGIHNSICSPLHFVSKGQLLLPRLAGKKDHLERGWLPRGWLPKLWSYKNVDGYDWLWLAMAMVLMFSCPSKAKAQRRPQKPGWTLQ